MAAFEFSSLVNSYAALTGRPADVGVIGVALFQEKPPLPTLREENILSDSSVHDYGNAAGLAKSRSAEPTSPLRDMGSESAKNASSNSNSNSNSNSKKQQQSAQRTAGNCQIGHGAWPAGTLGGTHHDV